VQHRIEFDGLEWQSPIAGVRERSVVQNGLRLRIVEYDRSMPLHWCEKRHYGMMLSGEMEIEYPEERLIYRSGDGIVIPAGSEHRHRARVLTEKATVFFVEGV
jgi:quercetin dioxygenase-like cupin family protein